MKYQEIQNLYISGSSIPDISEIGKIPSEAIYQQLKEHGDLKRGGWRPRNRKKKKLPKLPPGRPPKDFAERKQKLYEQYLEIAEKNVHVVEEAMKADKTAVSEGEIIDCGPDHFVRLQAWKELNRKVLPDQKKVEMSGKDGGPIEIVWAPDDEDDDDE